MSVISNSRKVYTDPMHILTGKHGISRLGPEKWFTGTVWLDEIVTAPAPASFKATRVSFAPGARTAWHTHPLGQALHILSGAGLIQVKGQSVHLFQAGDVVWIEAEELHWHGATPEQTMVHLALQQSDDLGVDVVWLDHVTDQEYAARP